MLVQIWVGPDTNMVTMVKWSKNREWMTKTRLYLCFQTHILAECKREPSADSAASVEVATVACKCIHPKAEQASNS